MEQNRSIGTRAAARAAILVLLLSWSFASVASPAPPLAAEEVRERRWIKEETPLWREALALPKAALGVAVWPLKQAFFCVERVNLPHRLADFVLYPFHHFGRQEERG
ncbi:MAG TPA: hypothetical protein VLF14_13035 [Candidatus Binatia bacterium]|nr:hypothetical protein [Candidatus Binatia bacterium]